MKCSVVKVFSIPAPEPPVFISDCSRHFAIIPFVYKTILLIESDRETGVGREHYPIYLFLIYK